MKPQGSNLVYQLKVTLLDSKPPIWRQLLVSSDTSLRKLHMILQNTLGWENSHLHIFKAGKIRYAHPNPEWENVRSDLSTQLQQVAPKAGGSFEYMYDMGDGWRHEILVEKISQDPRFNGVPLCLAGSRACPPEDCGGIGGYEEFLTAIRNPKHKRHEELLQWFGGPFDPEAFDVMAVNKALRALSRPSKTDLSQNTTLTLRSQDLASLENVRSSLN